MHTEAPASPSTGLRWSPRDSPRVQTPWPATPIHPLSLRMPMRWPISGLSVLHVPPAQGVDDGPAGYLSKVWPLIPAISLGCAP